MELLADAGGVIQCYARLRDTSDVDADTLTADLWLWDEEERLFGRICGS